MFKYFQLEKNNTTAKTEIYGGIATFLTLSYIIFVNPSILISAVGNFAPDSAMYAQYFGAFMVATIISAASATLIMGLLANYPFALAPGMGLNAYFTYTVCLTLGINWRVALGAVFVEGIIFILITLFGLRAFVVTAIPKNIKLATSAGIGIFLAFIGLKSSGFIIANPATFVSIGDMTGPSAITAFIGLLIICGLYAYKVPGSIMIGILAATVLANILGIAEFKGFFGAIPDIGPTFMQLQLSWQDLISPTFWVVVLTFFFADFFDTAGTLSGLSNSAGMADKDGNLPRANKAYMADAIGTSLGAVFGTSTVTTFIESGAGIAQGARTGLASVVTALLMLSALFFAPLAMSIPAAATAPALIFIGALMMTNIKDIEWDDVSEAVPAFFAIIMMPLTYSIANGIAASMIAYPLIKLVTGKGKSVNWLTWVLGASFILYFAYIR